MLKERLKQNLAVMKTAFVVTLGSTQKIEKITRQIGPNIKQWVELDMVEKVT